MVNAWNRNVIPWWLLLPQGVSGAIKRCAGYGPFRELSRKGVLPLGGAVMTGAVRFARRQIERHRRLARVADLTSAALRAG